jgi:dipeptidase D
MESGPGPYEQLEPAALWQHFAALNAIPRPSGEEQAALEYVRGAAEAAGASWAADGRGNAVARVPARGAAEGPIVAIQAHLDMVCESADGVEYDPGRDPVVPRRQGDLILASGTTLGADNGIGAAAALAVLSDPEAVHGPLELVFTVEEETGLHGAAGLDVSLLRAKTLINLDSEDDRALVVGCAGGADVTAELPVAREPEPPGSQAAEIRVFGLSGGHSGVQIHERHANAILLLRAVLERLREAGVGFRLAALDGGSAHNAIPRSATARLSLTGEGAEQAVAQAAAALRAEWGDDEPGLAIELVSAGIATGPVLSAAAATALAGLLGSVPHGVIAMSEHFEGTVETSANLAIVRTGAERIEVLSSVRSMRERSLRDVQDEIRAGAEQHGATAESMGGYPGWEPREGSPLLALAAAAYREVHGREPRIDVLHGGLECGVILAKAPELDAISFGPLIEGAHTPGERVHASTVSDTYRVLVKLLAGLAAQGA